MSGSILPEAQHFKVLEINTQPQLRCFRELMEFVSLEAVANLCLPHQFLDNGKSPRIWVTVIIRGGDDSFVSADKAALKKKQKLDPEEWPAWLSESKTGF